MNFNNKVFLISNKLKRVLISEASDELSSDLGDQFFSTSWIPFYIQEFI